MWQGLKPGLLGVWVLHQLELWEGYLLVRSLVCSMLVQGHWTFSPQSLEWHLCHQVWWLIHRHLRWSREAWREISTALNSITLKKPMSARRKHCPLTRQKAAPGEWVGETSSQWWPNPAIKLSQLLQDLAETPWLSAHSFRSTICGSDHLPWSPSKLLIFSLPCPARPHYQSPSLQPSPLISCAHPIDHNKVNCYWIVLCSGLSCKLRSWSWQSLWL